MFLLYSTTDHGFWVNSVAYEHYTTQLFVVFSKGRHISNLPTLHSLEWYNLVEQGSVKIYTQRLE